MYILYEHNLGTAPQPRVAVSLILGNRFTGSSESSFVCRLPNSFDLLSWRRYDQKHGCSKLVPSVYCGHSWAGVVIPRWGGVGFCGPPECDVRKMRCSNIGQCRILDNYITIQAEMGILLWVDRIDKITGENKIP